jgi:hypothetical protein
VGFLPCSGRNPHNIFISELPLATPGKPLLRFEWSWRAPNFQNQTTRESYHLGRHKHLPTGRPQTRSQKGLTQGLPKKIISTGGPALGTANNTDPDRNINITINVTVEVNVGFKQLLARPA